MDGFSRRTFLLGASGVAGLTALGPLGVSAAPEVAVDPWASAVGDARMCWRAMPADWRTAPLLGDGAVTASAVGGAHGGEIVFEVAAGERGRVVLDLAGTVTEIDWTLDLWNAELVGRVVTTRGSLGLSAMMPHGGNALRVVLESSPGADSAAVAGTGLAVRQRRDGGRQVIVAGPAGDPDALFVDDAVLAHRVWWHAYYRRSFVSVPDKSLQRFHWAQLYRAAATGPPVAAGRLAGPANQPSPASAAVGAVDPAGWGIPGIGSKGHSGGNPIAAWDLAGSWQRYRMTMDPALLRTEVQPALTKALGFYDAFLTEGADGALHLPMTHSPGQTDVADCTHDLALLRWAATRALDARRLLGTRDPRADRWRDIADRLTPYPSGPDGVMIGAGTPLGGSQPLPSHLVWLHPLREPEWRPGWDAAAVRRAVAHWTGMPAAWHGRSHATAAAMWALLGAGDDALGHLREFVHGDLPGDSGLTANATYREDGHPRDDGGYAAAGSLLDMLVRGGASAPGETRVAVFPAVPVSWREVSVAGLRTEGAFIVDAERTAGRAAWVRVRGESGERLVLRHGMPGPVRVRAAGTGVRWRASGPGEHTLTLPPGTSATLAAGPADPSPRDVPASGAARRWGLPGQDTGV